MSQALYRFGIGSLLRLCRRSLRYGPPFTDRPAEQDRPDPQENAYQDIEFIHRRSLKHPEKQGPGSDPGTPGKGV